MLEDIVEISKKVFDEAYAYNGSIGRAPDIYMIYKKLAELIVDAKCVASHYLALDMTNPFLQNSSFEEPVDKWRYVVNKDMERLNKYAKKYLLELSSLHKEETSSSFLDSYFHATSYCGFIRDSYSIGRIDPCGSMMVFCVLDTNFQSSKNKYLGQHGKINLSTLEARIELRGNIMSNCQTLNRYLKSLRSYIVSNFTIEDLM